MSQGGPAASTWTRQTLPTCDPTIFMAACRTGGLTKAVTPNLPFNLQRRTASCHVMVVRVSRVVCLHATRWRPHDYSQLCDVLILVVVTTKKAHSAPNSSSFESAHVVLGTRMHQQAHTT